jgi:hypothetical protein
LQNAIGRAISHDPAQAYPATEADNVRRNPVSN